jgi:hypothetical protein
VATSNTTLRQHLDKAHRDEYLRASSDKGWKIQLPSFKAPTEAPSESPSGSCRQSRTPSSAEELQNRLAKFIVANNQVSMALTLSLRPLCDLSDLFVPSLWMSLNALSFANFFCCWDKTFNFKIRISPGEQK